MQIEKLEALCDTKDAEANRLRQRHTSEKILLTEDIRALRENYEAKLKEYEELLDLKVQLDQEIATYRALLSEEEERSEAKDCVCVCVAQCFSLIIFLWGSSDNFLHGSR